MNPLISVGLGSTMEEVPIQSCSLALAVHADRFNWEMLCHQVVQVLENVTFVVLICCNLWESG